MPSKAMIAIIPLALMASACSETVFTADKGDSGEKSTAFNESYTALKHGDYLDARQELGQAHAQTPANAYEALDLGAAYQNGGDINSAVPLYRQAIAEGQDLHPADTTTKDAEGMTVAEIATRNLRIAGLDANGVPFGQVVIIVPATQSGSSTAAGARRLDVYFGFDQSVITPTAAAVIQQAAGNNPQQVSVIGHTDTAGPADDNQALSERRAEAVKAALNAAGVPAANIAVDGVGEAGLQVQTPQGVADAQNRRAELVVQ